LISGAKVNFISKLSKFNYTKLCKRLAKNDK
jgi:hypothetical protein